MVAALFKTGSEMQGYIPYSLKALATVGPSCCGLLNGNLLMDNPMLLIERKDERGRDVF